MDVPGTDGGPGGSSGAGAGRRLRRRERGTAERRKDHRYTVAVDDLEDAVVRVAAHAAGMTPGAWASRTVVAVARGEVTPLPSSLREVLRALIEARIAVVRIGTNLNQITAAVNTAATAGDDPAQAAAGPHVDAVLTRVRDALAHIDQASVAVMTALDDTRPDRPDRP